MNTPHWSKLPPLDEVMDDESMECLLANTGAYHDEEMHRAFAEGKAEFQSGVNRGWMVLPVGILTAIRRAAREIKRQRAEIEAARERIQALEMSLYDLIALEHFTVHQPRMDGKRRTYAFMKNGPALAASLDHARDVLGYDKMPTDPHHGGKLAP